MKSERGVICAFISGRKLLPSEIVKRCLGEMTNSRTAHLLHINCGRGFATQAFSGNGRTVIGIDSDHQAIADAQQHRGSKVEFQCGNMQTLPLSHLSFDGIIVFDSATLIQPVIDHAHRLLRSDGVLVVIDMHDEVFMRVVRDTISETCGIIGLGMPLSPVHDEERLFGKRHTWDIDVHERHIKQILSRENAKEELLMSTRWQTVLERRPSKREAIMELILDRLHLHCNYSRDISVRITTARKVD